MNERPVRPTNDTIVKQRQAGDPDQSIWVSANAGSGKTHILTERVLRILLTGVRPENILCLTYTKAAAAEMQRRVGDRLSEWAVSDEVALKKALTEMSGNAPSAAMIERARTLFAHALETPGGLKINTIHAFCEAVLHRFPFEAGVPVGFSVIEEAEQQEMLAAARNSVLAQGLAENEADAQSTVESVAEAVATLFSLMSDFAIHEAINKAFAQPRGLRDVLADPAASVENLREFLSIEPGWNRRGLEQEVLYGGQFTRSEKDSLLALTPSGAGSRSFEDKLAKLDWDQRTADQMFATFLIADGSVPKRGMPKAAVTKADPMLGEAIATEAARLAQLFEQRRSIDLFARSSALLMVLAAVHQRYEVAKTARNRLDFDDLVSRLVGLLANGPARDWVLYKLDSNLSHLLVDESQDTNPDQWRVVHALVDDFFDGEGATQRPRTVFAVGDEKQSIYSFQGADPALFGETGKALQRRAIQAKLAWENLRFRASFRTQENILNAVDEVCKAPHIQHALLAGDLPVSHESAREHKGGTVTLWPLVQQKKVVSDKGGNSGDQWPTQIAEDQFSAPRQLADKIASQISSWIAQNRALGQRGRAVSANDILILVQSRGALFNHLIRALKQKSIPTPGADRLPVTDHIVVADLLALADTLLNPSDDLTLAALLRSPLFDISEDQLAVLATGREKGVALWATLQALAKSAIWADHAYAQLSAWRNRLDFERPYEFFAQILFAENGLQRFHARMGEEIDDVIAEFLDLALEHERASQPGLLGFLAAMRSRDIAIKRELSETNAGVRVMTVHGAKGLEAPIVILADAATFTTKSGPIFVHSGLKPLLVHASSKDSHTAQTKSELREPDERSQTEEYWRKLYVAMTRAEDELYVTGYLNMNAGGRKAEGTWFEAIEKALTPLSDQTQTSWDKEQPTLRYPRGFAPPSDSATRAAPAAKPSRNMTDFATLPAVPSVELIMPSLATAHTQEWQAASTTGSDQASKTAGQNPVAADAARLAGTSLHTLLQHLEKVPVQDRPQMALGALKTLLPSHPATHSDLADKAIAILSGPNATYLFGPNSRAEVSFAARGTNNGKPMRVVGRVDRVIVENDKVLLVDYKSDASPPATADEVSEAYLVQLGLYLRAAKKYFPNKQIDAALFWTSNELLMPLPRNALLDATSQFIIR